MPEQLIQWMEIIFDLTYLVAVWILTILMYKNWDKLTPENKTVGKLFTLAFFLLALGDTGHVGFRVPAHLLGGLEANQNLVGIGGLATAITVTFFYMVVAEIWRVRFDKKRGFFWWTLIIFGIIRLVVMAFPQNAWLTHSASYEWSLARNIPLMIQGLAVAIAILVCGIKNKDKFSINISIMIFLSYAFYTPVILFVREIPMLGMLMIPKTLAYVAIAAIAYVVLFRRQAIKAK